ncbi:MAG: hypothetical protein GTO18_00860 [Anaerolineales bacterium]|nr:hypothetical protein [Anaerolineales bacterium]
MYPNYHVAHRIAEERMNDVRRRAELERLILKSRYMRERMGWRAQVAELLKSVNFAIRGLQRREKRIPDTDEQARHATEILRRYWS